MKVWVPFALISFVLSGCAQSADSALPEVIVHKSASCGCCKVWAQHLRNVGFPVTMQNTDLAARRDAGTEGDHRRVDGRDYRKSARKAEPALDAQLC